MGQLITIGLLIYLLVTYGFWQVVLYGALLVISVLVLAAAISPFFSEKTTSQRAKVGRKAVSASGRPTNGAPESYAAMGCIRTGLIIDEPWISKITNGEKIWEMRSRPTSKRERIALIRKGSGTVVGIATIKEVMGPFDDQKIAATFEQHRVPTHMIGKWRYGWVLENVRKLATPVPYIHRSGAVTWVTLDSASSSILSLADAPED